LNSNKTKCLASSHSRRLIEKKEKWKIVVNLKLSRIRFLQHKPKPFSFSLSFSLSFFYAFLAAVTEGFLYLILLLFFLREK
jgi:hypothetical protein